YEHTIQRTPIDAETRERLQALGYVSETKTPQQKQFTVDDDPKKLIGYHNMVHLAMGYREKGQNGEALDLLQKVMNEQPKYSLPYLYSAEIYYEQHHPEEAVNILQQAVQKGVVGIDIRGKLALYLFQTGKIDESIQQLKLALQQDPRDV